MTDALQRMPALTRLLFGVRVPATVAQTHWDTTTLLLATALREALPPGGRLLEVGTGEAGTLATYAARRLGARVVGLDVRPEAVASARRIADLNGVKIEARLSDLLDAVAGEAFDVVAFNPPYIPTAVGFRRGLHRRMPGRPIWDGGARGDAVVTRFLDAAGALRAGTTVLLGFSTAYVDLPRVRAAAAARGLAERRVVRRPWTRSVVVEMETRVADGG